jgi:putative alpha-1,2-mannosidase
VLGSPVFDKTRIRLDNGKTFTLVANNNSRNNKYIQSVKLNGKPLEKLWFTHHDLISGATLELEMGDTPNRRLGTSPESLPPASATINPQSIAAP